MAAKFHLGWFFDGHVPTNWRSPFSRENGDGWGDPAFFSDFARALERSGFDYVLVEDTTFVPDEHEGRMDAYLKYGIATPKLDGSVLAGYMLEATSQMGVVSTLSTTEYLPYHLARVMASLDHLSAGRSGWNIVTGVSDRAQQNYGRAEIPEHDKRYEMADEFVDVCLRLWDSWDADAVVKDREKNVFADPAKVRTINYEGTYFSSRGPLVTPRPPQGRPLLTQAGASPAGRQLAAKYADSILGIGATAGQMKAYRDDVRSRMAALGRNPDDCKVLFIAHATVGATEAEAQAEAERQIEAIRDDPMEQIATMSKNSSFDFGQFDPDSLVWDIAAKFETKGTKAGLAAMLQAPEGTTLRDFATTSNRYFDLIGTPESIADQMEQTMDEVGGDGFLLTDFHLDRRSLAAISDGLIPELRRRGLVRREYEHDTARANLLAY